MDATAMECSALESPSNAGKLCDGHSVAELDMLDSQIEDLLDHGFAISMAGIVPAGGERKHAKLRRLVGVP